MNKAFSILLVDDDEDDRDIFCDTVEELDSTFLCNTAFDGFDALEQLNNTSAVKPDLIFLDLNMPRLNGKQLLLQIKTNPLWNKIPVVVYSTSRLLKDIEDIKELGATEFISKPARAQELKKAISSVIKPLVKEQKTF